MTKRGTKDYMLTVWARDIGGRDVEVDNASDMLTAIALAERETGCRVDHGRSGILSQWEPSIVIDAQTGIVHHVHDRTAETSMTIHTPKMGKR